MNDKIDEKQKQEIEWRKKYFQTILFSQTKENLEKLPEEITGKTPDKTSIDSILALQIPFLGVEIIKQLREDADKVYSFLTATHHASTLKSVGTGFAGASIALHGLDFLRIPAIYLASFILGRKVPFTLKNNAKWLYAASLLALSIAALAVPAVAPFIGIAAASLAVAVGAFTLARHFYRKREIKKELADIKAEIKKAENELEDLKNSQVEKALDDAIEKASLKFSSTGPEMLKELSEAIEAAEKRLAILKADEALKDDKDELQALKLIKRNLEALDEKIQAGKNSLSELEKKSPLPKEDILIARTTLISAEGQKKDQLSALKDLLESVRKKDKEMLESMKKELQGKNSAIEAAEKELKKATEQPTPKTGLPSLARYILGPSTEEKARTEAISKAKAELEKLRAEKRKLFAAIPGKEQLILAGNFQARFDKAQTQDDFDAIFDEMEGFNNELRAKAKHLQSLHDSVAELEAEDKAMGAMAVVDKGVGTILGAVVLAGMVTALFFPPIGAAILLGVAAVASTYLVGRLATPLFKKLGSWVSSQFKSAEKPAAEEQVGESLNLTEKKKLQADTALHKTRDQTKQKPQLEQKAGSPPLNAAGVNNSSTAGIVVGLVRGDMEKARELTVSLINSDKRKDVLDSKLQSLVNTKDLSGIKGFFDALALGIEDKKIDVDELSLLSENNIIYKQAMPLLQQALEAVTDKTQVPQALLDNDTLKNFLIKQHGLDGKVFEKIAVKISNQPSMAKKKDEEERDKEGKGEKKGLEVK